VLFLNYHYQEGGREEEREQPIAFVLHPSCGMILGSIASAGGHGYFHCSC